jgi:hypothetical protein
MNYITTRITIPCVAALVGLFIGVPHNAHASHDAASPVGEIPCPSWVRARYLCVLQPITLTCRLPDGGFAEPICFSSGLERYPLVRCPEGFVLFDRTKPLLDCPGELVQ